MQKIKTSNAPGIMYRAAKVEKRVYRLEQTNVYWCIKSEVSDASAYQINHIQP
jgi:hypothetical protein